MNLTVDELIDAIFAARDIEVLQRQVRDALIERVIRQSSSDTPKNPTTSAPEVII